MFLSLMTAPKSATNSDRNSASVEALQDVLDPVIDGINQLFFHSRALRAWGITDIGRAEHMEWIVKMQLAEMLVVRLSALDGAATQPGRRRSGLGRWPPTSPARPRLKPRAHRTS